MYLRISPRTSTVLFFFIVGLSCAAALPVFGAPPLPGAIFTTTENGTRVNANIFSAKCDAQGVYLDGGPGPNAPVGAAGLPDGDYYYMVTDPSGATLLSTDPVKYRRFTVTGGIITSRVAPQSADDHETGTDVDHGALTIELCPFLDTPNNGGEYKVWVTPVDDFVGDPNAVDSPCDPNGGCSHGFIHAATKTDNFKVKAKAGPCITIRKFQDDGDGRLESGEPLLQWPVTVIDPLGTTLEGLVFTGNTSTKEPDLRFCPVSPGTYVVTEAADPGDGSCWDVTATIVNGKYKRVPSRQTTVSVRSSDVLVIFGNTPCKK